VRHLKVQGIAQPINRRGEFREKTNVSDFHDVFLVWFVFCSAPFCALQVRELQRFYRVSRTFLSFSKLFYGVGKTLLAKLSDCPHALRLAIRRAMIDVELPAKG
jgi:hypothetical protein